MLEAPIATDAAPSPRVPSPPFQWRVSTLLVLTALLVLSAGVILNAVNERHFTDRGDLITTALLFVVFPAAAITGAVSAAVLLAWKRRAQFAIELAICLLLVVYFSFWESL